MLTVAESLGSKDSMDAVTTKPEPSAHKSTVEIPTLTQAAATGGIGRVEVEHDIPGSTSTHDSPAPPAEDAVNLDEQPLHSKSASAQSSINSSGFGGLGRDHPRTLLNNVAQNNGWTVTYEASWTGPQENPRWTVVVFVNNIEYGRGIGPTKGAAKDKAARDALVALGVLD
ncbi:DRBM domain-containing protein [Mycena venus]|uniref:DRBM domain-containing protein n=1 Tax=Mycena venus TaxID=2733690 RepID=A0A8H6Y1Y2_9AGAR|nr:DRBM domain-containing protein [Mycena venus]